MTGSTAEQLLLHLKLLLRFCNCYTVYNTQGHHVTFDHTFLYTTPGVQHLQHTSSPPQTILQSTWNLREGHLTTDTGTLTLALPLSLALPLAHTLSPFHISNTCFRHRNHDKCHSTALHCTSMAPSLYHEGIKTC